MAPLAAGTARGMTRRLGRIGLEFVVPVAAIAIWWVASAGSSSFYFPALPDIIAAFRETWISGQFVSDALPSLANLAGGFAVATLVGVLLGLGLGRAPRVADALAPILELLRAVPGVATVPAFLLVLGIGSSMKISVIAFAAVWPVLLNTIDGVRSVDPVVSDVARSYRIRRTDWLLRMVLRAASPQIVAGMRTALSIAVIMIVFSELVGSNTGIGYQLLQYQRSFAIPEMWATMVFLGVLGYLLNIAFRGFEAGVLSWHRGMRLSAE